MTIATSATNAKAEKLSGSSFGLSNYELPKVDLEGNEGTWQLAASTFAHQV